jgi:hypothetical protein
MFLFSFNTSCKKLKNFFRQMKNSGLSQLGIGRNLNLRHIPNSKLEVKIMGFDGCGGGGGCNWIWWIVIIIIFFCVCRGGFDGFI